MSVLYNRRLRVCWGVASAVGAVASVYLEISFRASGHWSPLAPSATLFTAGIVAGLACGAVGAAWEHYLLRHKRDWLTKFHRLQLRERLRWPVQRENWAANGWLMAVFLGLLACCEYWGISIFPPLLAVNAVQGLANHRLAAGFDAHLSSAAG